MSSRFRSEIRRYVIYCIWDDMNYTVYITKSYSKTPKKQYSAHINGKCWGTKYAYEAADKSKLQYIVLEILYCTGNTAFKHILAWYQFFAERGYITITEEKIEFMMDNMDTETQKIYDEVCLHYGLEDVLNREVIDPAQAPEVQQNEKSKDKLVQMNMRIKASVADAYRSFCKKRKITQSEGLQLLLMGEEMETRDQLLQNYQQELAQKDNRIAELEEQNKQLLALQRGKESWALQQRKEWTSIAQNVLRYVIAWVVPPKIDPDKREKKLRLKNRDGYALFQSCNYPAKGGCFVVTIKGLIWGLQRDKSHVERNCPLFVCGELQDGTAIKARWYSKKEYMGIAPTAEVFTCWKGTWLIGCVIAKDGAADLVCAVPLPRSDQPYKIEAIVDANSESGEENTANIGKPRLDFLIDNASGRSRAHK